MTTERLLDAPVVSERQATFRKEYRARIARWYRGWMHIAAIYVIGGGALYGFSSQLGAVAWYEYLVIPLVVVLTSIFEWAIHRYIMHRPRKPKLLRAIYRRHTLMHHQFFTHEVMSFENFRDLRVVLFPPYALVTFIIMSGAPAAALWFLIGPNAAWFLLASTTSMYLIYEFFHFCCHVPENWFVRNMPCVNTIRRHHWAHHAQNIMMEKNMTLTFPIADWMFGTSDLDRGLLGTLFNGYNTEYVRSDLRHTERTPRGIEPAYA